MPISEGRARKIAILYIVLFFFSYPLQGLSYEFLNEDDFHQIVVSLLIVFGYHLMWSAIGFSLPGREGVKTARRRFMVSVPLYLFYMGYLIIILFPPLLAALSENILPLFVIVGFFLALLNPILISYVIHLEERIESLKKKVRKRGVKGVDDLKDFEELKDAVGIAKVLASHEDAQVRKAAMDLLFKIHDPKMIKYVKEALGDDELYIQLRAALLLFLWCDKSGWTILQERFHELSTDDRLEVVKWIPECEWEGSRVILEQALDDDDHEIRKLAAELIEYF
jgi:hypothetical protein